MAPQMWSADFHCEGKTEEGCGALITVRTQLVIVQGPGTEVSCTACHARYVVTESGAQMIRDGLNVAGVYPPQAGRYNVPERPSSVPPWNPHWEDPE